MRAPAPAKINLALVVGPMREDGKHEVLTVLQRIDPPPARRLSTNPLYLETIRAGLRAAASQPGDGGMFNAFSLRKTSSSTTLFDFSNSAGSTAFP